MDFATRLHSFHPQQKDVPYGYTWLFSIQKQTILINIKEIKEVCAGVLEYVEHILLRIDTEIFKKWRFRMKTI